MNAIQKTAFENLIEVAESLNEAVNDPHVGEVIEVAKFALAETILTGIYHDTLEKAIRAATNELKAKGAELTNFEFLAHIPYGQTAKADFPLASFKGKPTRKFGHISIYRMDSGNGLDQLRMS